MPRVFFLLSSMIFALNGSCQRKDTIRIYNYETGLFKFELTVMNNKEFTFIDNRFSDTLNGHLKKQDGGYSFSVDTSLLKKWRRSFIAVLSKA